MLAVLTTVLVVAATPADAPTVEAEPPPEHHTYYAVNSGPASSDIRAFRRDEGAVPMLFEASVGCGKREGSSLNLSVSWGGPVRHGRLRVGFEQLIGSETIRLQTQMNYGAAMSTTGRAGFSFGVRVGAMWKLTESFDGNIAILQDLDFTGDEMQNVYTIGAAVGLRYWVL